ncbi:hypothetical protein PENSPDRAFT_659953, partial [Peniophora sp. CONT]
APPCTALTLCACPLARRHVRTGPGLQPGRSPMFPSKKILLPYESPGLDKLTCQVKTGPMIAIARSHSSIRNLSSVRDTRLCIFQSTTTLRKRTMRQISAFHVCCLRPRVGTLNSKRPREAWPWRDACFDSQSLSCTCKMRHTGTRFLAVSKIKEKGIRLLVAFAHEMGRLRWDRKEDGEENEGEDGAGAGTAGEREGAGPEVRDPA